MIRLLRRLTLAVVGVGITTAFAQDVQVKEHKLAYGITLRGGYDSNVDTKEKGASGSLYSSVSPDIQAAWSSPATDLTMHYTYTGTYYDNRPEKQWDQAHDFTFNLAHEFSPRLRVTLAEQFTPGFEPEIEQGNRTSSGDYIQNNVRVSPSYDLGGRWTLPVSLSHYLISYSEAEAAESLNRQMYEASVGAKYTVNSKTSVFADFTHTVNTYEGINRSYTGEMLDVGFHHAIGPRLMVDARVGASMMMFDVKSSADFNPVMSLNATYSLSSRTVMNFSFRSQYQPTEVNQYLAQYSWTTAAGIVHQFTPKLMASANITYIPAEYDSNLTLSASDLQSKYNYTPATGGGQETTWASSVSASYQFNIHLRGEIGYSYIQVSSDFEDRTYNRQLTYLQARLGF